MRNLIWHSLVPPSIQKIQLAHFNISLPQVLSDSSHGEIASFGLNTARVTTEDGLEGLGYSYVVGNIGGSAIYSLLRDALAPFLLKAEPVGIKTLWNQMWWYVHFVGRGGLASFALATLDIALWDLLGKTSGKPWYQILGGSRRPVAAYAGGIDLQFTLDELLHQTDGFLEQGFQAIKMKVGRPQIAEDVRRVEAMRKHLGADFPLMVDANMQWEPAEAIVAAQALAPSEVYWLEEPIIPDSYAEHSRIAREGGLPIATGENLHSLHEFELMITLGKVAFPEPDLVTLGGVTPWLQVAQLCQELELPVTTHGVHDLHVQLLAGVPNASYLEVHGFGLERFMPEPLELVNGNMLPPERPGHGVILNEGSLNQYKQASCVVI